VTNNAAWLFLEKVSTRAVKYMEIDIATRSGLEFSSCIVVFSRHYLAANVT
jgi:hypothetical protein